MRRTSNSVPDSASPPHALVPVYEARRRRTVQLVEEGAQALKAERLSISLATLAARTRQLDPDGKGVSETTIQRNPEARAIYEFHRSAVGIRTVKRSTIASGGEARLGALAIKPQRDLARAHRRYQRLPKTELVERVLIAEQAFASERQLRLRTADELLVWMQLAAQFARSSVGGNC